MNQIFFLQIQADPYSAGHGGPRDHCSFMEVNGVFWGGLGGMALLEEVCHWSQALRVKTCQAVVVHAFNPSTWEAEDL